MLVTKCAGQELKRREYPNFELSLTRYMPNQVIDFHHHARPYFSMLINGCYFEKNEFNTSTVAAGDLIVRPTNYLHHNKFSDTTGICFNIEFTTHEADPFWVDLLDEQTDVKIFNNARLKAFEMYHAFAENHNSLHIESLLSEVIAIKHNLDGTAGKRSSVPWLKKLIDYLHDHVYENISLKVLSKECCVNAIYMTRAFKARYGLTIGEYHRKLRLNQSFSDLLNNPDSLTGISKESGYYDQSHMIRQFVSATGIPPLKIRKSVKRFI